MALALGLTLMLVNLLLDLLYRIADPRLRGCAI
jgi:ABC-type dipeptide/oligopeptide/nickel transport system permease component